MGELTQKGMPPLPFRSHSSCRKGEALCGSASWHQKAIWPIKLLTITSCYSQGCNQLTQVYQENAIKIWMHVRMHACSVPSVLWHCWLSDIKCIRPVINGDFPGGLGLPCLRIYPFWILLELRMMEVVVTTGAIRRAKLQLNRHQQHTYSQFLQAGYPSCRPIISVFITVAWKTLASNHKGSSVEDLWWAWPNLV